MMSDLDGIEEMYNNIKLLFDFAPPQLSLRPEASSAKTATASQSSFYNKHLDRRYMLKRVIIMPSLASHISSTVDLSFDTLQKRNVRLPFTRETIMVSTTRSREFSVHKGPVADAKAVAKAYQSATSQFCRPIASMLSLSPQAPEWGSLLIWNINPSLRLDDADVWEEDFGTQLVDVSDPASFRTSKNVVDSLGDRMLATLTNVGRKFPILDVWDFMVPLPEAVEILGAMADLHPVFQHNQCINVGYSSRLFVDLFTQDATTTPWGGSMSSFVDSQDDKHSPPISHKVAVAPSATKNSRGAKRNQVVNSGVAGCRRKDNVVLPSFHWPNITIPQPPIGESAGGKNSTAKSVLQRAWSRSVHRDSTFIIFHCGNFERIGLRHRATQTLFLSDLIDVPHCKDPGYGKIHLGLYLSILHDVLDRMEQISDSAAGQSKARKRPRSNTVTPGNAQKKPRTRAAAAKDKVDEIERREALTLLTTPHSTRNLALIQFRYGVYNSPAPAIFRRSGQPNPRNDTTYGPQQYLSIVITSSIAAGAVGNVHGATLAALTPDGATRTLDVVVKFSFLPQKQEKMRHEFLIYEKLASSGVGGVPVAIGLFEDLESETLALVMTHVGVSLTTLNPGMTETPVLEPARSEFIQVLKGIHDAGIHHRDIRSENLCLDTNNKPYIIDFDRAKLNPSAAVKQREIYRLTCLLEGDAFENSPMPSTPDKGGESNTDEDSELNSDEY